jgi:autophagy-related protein 18
MAYPQPSKQPLTAYGQPAHSPPPPNFLPPSTGEVLIYDANKLESINVIEAHQSTLGYVAINNQGTLLATASEKGTIIRVFSLPSGERLYHFRRGSLPAQIYCMSFNSTSSLLSVSSATETIHIFKLVAQQSPFRPAETPPASPAATNPRNSSSSPGRRRGESFSSYRDRSQSPGSDDADTSTPTEPTASTPTQQVRGATGTLASFVRRTSQNVGMTLAARVGGYLPTSVTEMWEPARDFAWVKIPRVRQSLGASGAPGPIKSVVAMSSAHPQLLVVTSEGQFLVFNVDLEKGGEGVLEKQAS